MLVGDVATLGPTVQELQYKQMHAERCWFREHVNSPRVRGSTDSINIASQSSSRIGETAKVRRSIFLCQGA